MEEKNLIISEEYFELTENDQRIFIGENPAYETFTSNLSILYSQLQKEHGKCLGKIYVDTIENLTLHIGYMFQKKRQYEDCNKYYTQIVDVIFHNKIPEKTITYYYQDLNKK